MSDFFDKPLDELLSTSTAENRQKTDIIVEKILNDFEELGKRYNMVYPEGIKPLWKN